MKITLNTGGGFPFGFGGSKPNSIGRVIGKVVALMVSFGGLTVTYFSMRAVLAVGGFCAEGGPYQIAVHCPEGIVVLMPLGMMSMVFAALVYIFIPLRNSPQWALLFWSALFGALGWNFLDFALNPPVGDTIAWGWMISAVMFGLMAAVPLLFLLFTGKLGKILFGEEDKGVTVEVSGPYDSQGLLVALHFLAAAGGVYIGHSIFFAFAA